MKPKRIFPDLDAQHILKALRQRHPLPEWCFLEEVRLGTAIIANDLTGDDENGHYAFVLSKWGRPRVPWEKGSVEGFKRQDRGPWDLLYLVLDKAVGKRNAKIIH